MVKLERRWVLPAVAALALLGTLYAWWGGGSTPMSGPAASASNGTDPVVAEADLPRIDLARLGTERPPSELGRRDIFDFGVPPTPPPPPYAPPTEVLTATPPPTLPTPPPLPPLNIKYIGALEDKKGLKVAMFLTEQKEVLTGQPGQVVANRFKVVRIGLESVDIQELGAEQTRRIPLKGN